jgi:putative transposase
VLLAFYDFPAELWIHLRITNLIESTFATVRLRQRATKGPGSSAAGIAMACEPIAAAQARRRAVNAPLRTATSSNEPTHQAVTRKLRDTPITRS